MAPGVVDLSLQTMAEPLHRGQLKTIVVTVRAGRELDDRAESGIGQPYPHVETQRPNLTVAAPSGENRLHDFG